MIRILTVGVFIALGASTASGQTPGTAVPAVARRSATPTVSGEAVRAGVPARGPAVLPGTRATAFSRIQGNALDSKRSILPDSAVRLRDARAGRIVSAQTTDKSGLFEFRDLNPGSYIVELLGVADTVLAASQLININAAETVTTVVQLPFRLSPLGGLFGHTTAQAIAITTAAAATGVLNAATTTNVSDDGTN